MARTNKTPIRLSKMAWSLASFASNKILMNGGHVDDASRLWKEDLEWLRREFYEGHFGFPWPAYPSPILRDDSAIAGKWNGTSRHFAALRNFVAIGGIADMAGLAAGSTRSRMIHTGSRARADYSRKGGLSHHAQAPGKLRLSFRAAPLAGKTECRADHLIC
jgi:hypothetical protein